MTKSKVKSCEWQQSINKNERKTRGSQTAYRFVDSNWQSGKRPQRVFGALFPQGGRLVLRMISVVFKGETHWQHLTLK